MRSGNPAGAGGSVVDRDEFWLIAYRRNPYRPRWSGRAAARDALGRYPTNFVPDSEVP
jgi:hypothetical protein